MYTADAIKSTIPQYYYLNTCCKVQEWKPGDHGLTTSNWINKNALLIYNWEKKQMVNLYKVTFHGSWPWF